MTTIELKTFLKQAIDKLPESLLLELKEWIVNVMENRKKEPKPLKKRQAGCLKGFFSYMVPDFNEPLEDFKEYM